MNECPPHRTETDVGNLRDEQVVADANLCQREAVSNGPSTHGVEEGKGLFFGVVFETESSRRDVGIIFSVLFIEKKRDVEEVAVALLLLFFIVNNELPSQDSSEIFYLIWFLHKESPREERQHGNVPWSKWLLNIPRASLWEWHKQRPEAVIWQ